MLFYNVCSSTLYKGMHQYVCIFHRKWWGNAKLTFSMCKVSDWCQSKGRQLHSALYCMYLMSLLAHLYYDSSLKDVLNSTDYFTIIGKVYSLL